MRPPKWENKVNPTTVLAIFQLLMLVGGGGYVLSELQTGRAANAESIERMRGEIHRINSMERTLSILDHRVVVAERQVTDALTGMRAVENSISGLSSDIRLMREILERLERTTNQGDPRRSQQQP